MNHSAHRTISSFVWLLAGPAACVAAAAQLLLAPPAAEEWIEMLTWAVALAVGCWGLAWSVACLLALVVAARRLASRSGHDVGPGRVDPGWVGRLPRRAVLSAAVASGLLAALVGPAHAAGPGSSPTTVSAPVLPGPLSAVHAAAENGSGADAKDLGWPLTGPSATDATEARDAADATQQATAVPPSASASHDPSAGFRASRPAQVLPRAMGGAGRDEVLVSHGDTLWDIAAARLGTSATDADIAREWPLWYRANQDVIGPDPGLLLPGTVLHPPD